MAISVVKRNVGTDAATNGSIALTFANNTAHNASIVVGTTDGPIANLSTPTDTSGNVYQLLATIDGGWTIKMKLWACYDIATSAGVNTVTMNDSFSLTNMFIFEVAGLATSLAFDKQASAQQGSATALSSGNTATTTNANELLLGITGNANTLSLLPTIGAGYSNLQTTGSTNMWGGSEEAVVGSTGAQAATFTLPANATNSTTAIFTFSDTIIVSVPTVTTQAVTVVKSDTAVGNGNITSTGGATPDKKGIVFDTVSHADPGNTAPGSSLYPNKTEETGSFTTGAFTETLNVQPNKTHFARAYAHNSVGYSYGAEVSFTTLKNYSILTNKLRPAIFKPGLAR